MNRHDHHEHHVVKRTGEVHAQIQLPQSDLTTAVIVDDATQNRKSFIADLVPIVLKMFCRDKKAFKWWGKGCHPPSSAAIRNAGNGCRGTDADAYVCDKLMCVSSVEGGARRGEHNSNARSRSAQFGGNQSD